MRNPLRVALAIITFALVVIVCVAAVVKVAHAQSLTCTPVVVTLHDYDHGIRTLDGCLGSRGVIHYGGVVQGLTVTMTSPNNLDWDGIFRNGFEP